MTGSSGRANSPEQTWTRSLLLGFPVRRGPCPHDQETPQTMADHACVSAGQGSTATSNPHVPGLREETLWPLLDLVPLLRPAETVKLPLLASVLLPQPVVRVRSLCIITQTVFLLIPFICFYDLKLHIAQERRSSCFQPNYQKMPHLLTKPKVTKCRSIPLYNDRK